ncbi:MAG: hypothetical protein KME18_26885 [Phormidium tanganyikae FI6-MK23]|jgi:hypothetical protein|nr:hypothetical protein [Phormidium tanganyikae FI6-MK23]
MNCFKVVLVTLVMLINFAIAPVVLADPPKLTTTPEYTEVTTAIADLLKAKSDPEASDLSPVDIEQKLGALNLQKYILETASNWSQCRNETGHTIAVYAHKAKKTPVPSTLYYLATGQTTDDDWNCDAVYLPAGAKLAGQPELTEPIALQFVSGTQLVAKTNPTGEIEFNLPPAKTIIASADSSLPIPTNLTLASVEATTPNAPIED